MIGAMTWLRLCFVVLFGAMSIMHGPVMTFAVAHSAGPADTAHSGAERFGDAGHSVPDCHEDQAPATKHGQCNAFACLMAVEPPPVAARPLRTILFAEMAAGPDTLFDPVRTAPALPPPRLQG